MQTQLEIQDAKGKNLAMLAARCGNVAILKAVMAEIVHTGVSKRVSSLDIFSTTVRQLQARNPLCN